MSRGDEKNKKSLFSLLHSILLYGVLFILGGMFLPCCTEGGGDDSTDYAYDTQDTQEAQKTQDAQPQYIIKGTLVFNAKGALPQECLLLQTTAPSTTVANTIDIEDVEPAPLVDDAPQYDATQKSTRQKSAFPTLPLGNLLYCVTASLKADPATTISGTVDSANSCYEIALTKGVWQIEALLKDAKGNNIAKSTTLTVDTDSPPDPSSTNLSLAPDIQSGTGGISLAVNVQSNIKSAYVSLVSGGSTSVNLTQTLDFAQSTTQTIDFDSSTTPIASGVYDLSITFYSLAAGAGQVLYSVHESVNVFNCLTTNKWVKGLSSYIDDTGDFCITDAMTQVFGKTSFYVASNGLDTNSGSFFKPFASVKQALDTIKDINDKTSQYTIFIKDDIQGENACFELSFSDTINLKICPSSSAQVSLDANSKGRLAKIDAQGVTSKITIQNLKITGGKPSSGGGGGVYVAGGDVTLKNCLITSNVSAITGGGALCGGGKTTFDNCTIQNNSASTMGGGVMISGATAIFDSCIIKDNSLLSTQTKKGAGIYINTGSLKVSGKTSVGSLASDNDIYLAKNTFITVEDALGDTSFINVSSDVTQDSTAVLKAITGFSLTKLLCQKFYLQNCTGKEIVLDIATGQGIIKTRCDFYVSSTGLDTNAGTKTAPFASVKQALDTIEDINDGVTLYTVFIKDDITNPAEIELTTTKKLNLLICSQDDSQKIITAASANRVMSIVDTNSSKITLKNLSFTGGNIAKDGAGVYIEGDANTTVDFVCCKIYGNTATGNSSGGGVYIFGANVNFDSSTAIYSNSANSGGGVCVLGGTVTLNGTTIGGDTSSLSNTATTAATSSADGGGGLCFLSGTLILDGAIIKNNTATSYGAGLLLLGNVKNINDSNIKITNCTIDSNVASNKNGAGIYIENSTVEIKDTNITKNTASNMGAGIYIENAKVNINNTNIAQNTTSGLYGGGLYIKGDTIEIKDTTITQNESRNLGAGVYIYQGDVTLDSSSISQNTSGGVIDTDAGVYMSTSSTTPLTLCGTLKIGSATDANSIKLYFGTKINLKDDLPQSHINIDSQSTTLGTQILGLSPSATITQITQDICDKFMPQGTLARANRVVSPSQDKTQGILAQLPVFYVSSAGLDTNAGTKTAPFASVKKALDTIEGINDGTSQYTINILSDIQGENARAKISPAKSLNLILQKEPSVTQNTITLDVQGLTSGIFGSVLSVQEATSGNTTLVVNNLTLTGGLQDTGNNGGGVEIDAGGVTFNNCIIKGNSCTNDFGGGVYTNGDVTFNNCTIIENTAQKGAGVYANTADVYLCGKNTIGSSSTPCPVYVQGSAYDNHIFIDAATFDNTSYVDVTPDGNASSGTIIVGTTDTDYDITQDILNCFHLQGATDLAIGLKSVTSGSSTYKVGALVVMGSSVTSGDGKFKGTVNADGSITLDKYSDPSGGTVEIPSEIAGCPVTKIPDGMFQGSNVTIVKLPSSIKEIGEGAFKDVTSLNTVELNEGLLVIGDHAFQGCNNIQEVKIPESVTTIGEYAFAQCSSIKKIIIPDSVINIGGFVFTNCTDLKEVQLPSSITQIPQDAFYNTGLTKLDLTNTNVEEICSQAFQGCGSLQQITLPATLKTIGVMAFSKCGGLTNIGTQGIQSNSVTIPANAFNYCNALADEYKKAINDIATSTVFADVN